MKDKILFLKNFLKKLGKDFKPSVKELKVPKSSFFLCDEYITLSRKVISESQQNLFKFLGIFEK
mgnify:CR=1 FL=1